MKKTIIALMALVCVAHADTLSLYDQWTFDTNWTSVGGRSFAGSNTAITETYDGDVEFRLYNGMSGWKLSGDNGLDLTTNWAVQITLTLDLGDDSSFRNNGVIFTTNSQGGNSGGMRITAVTDGTTTTNAYQFTNEDGYQASFSYGEPVTYTMLNYDGQIYMAVDNSWYKVVLSDSSTRDYIASNYTLDELSIGYNGSDHGLSPDKDVYVTLDNISVYTFDTKAVTLGEVKAALVPEPTTATLSLLALCGLAARRRRK